MKKLEIALNGLAVFGALALVIWAMAWMVRPEINLQKNSRWAFQTTTSKVVASSEKR